MNSTKTVLLISLLGLVFPATAHAASTDILSDVLNIFKQAFLDVIGSIDDVLINVWNKYLKGTVMKYLGGVIEYMKDQWNYRKGILKSEWEAEKVELLQSITDLWNKIF